MLNPQHLVVDQNYRIELYERFKKASQIFPFLRLE